MTVTSTTVRAYDDTGVTTCDGCGDELAVDETRDCGTHTHCADCLTESPCRECKRLRAEAAQDAAEQWAYDTWRDREDHSDV